ncbi:hypothetical protein HNV12_11670 [Methanococcoides sp. SA1]|nr:hypothetical protein [Methanococcoides sp. SA1]
MDNKKSRLNPVWVTRASIGLKGLQEECFLEENLIAIGWNRLGNLFKYKSNEEMLKHDLEKLYPDKNSRQTSHAVGRIKCFLDEMAVNQFVVLPRYEEQSVVIGRIKGDYEYKPGEYAEYNNSFDEGKEVRNVRKVKWVTTIDRSQIDENVLKSLNAPLSLYKVNEEATRYIQHLYHEKKSA